MRLALVLLSLTLLAAPASAHGLVSIGVTEDTDATLLAVSVFGDAEGAVAVTLHGDARGSVITWSICGPAPCATLDVRGPDRDGLGHVVVGMPHSSRGIAVHDGDANGDQVAVSLFGRADCEGDCSGTSQGDPVALLAVSGTGCADGHVAVSGSDCAVGLVAVDQRGIEGSDGDELVVALIFMVLP